MTDELARPDVAVVVPVFNRLRLLRDTLDSLRRQTLRSAEFLLVDDGSDKETLDYLFSLPQTDSRFRIIPKPAGMERGAQTSRNLGLSECAATAIMFLDSDDLLAPTCLAERFRNLERDPAVDAVVGRQAIFDESTGSLRWVNVHRGEVRDLDRFLDLACPLDVPWVTGGALFRTSRLIAGEIAWVPHLLWQDVVFHVQCMIAGLNVVWLAGEEPDSFYRHHSDDHFGHVLHTAAGMRGIVDVLSWMKRQLARANLLTDARGRTLEKTFFHTCVLRAVDRNDFPLARELVANGASGELFPAVARIQMHLYVNGRWAVRGSRRATYYWNRFAALTFLRSYYPGDRSTYGTLEVHSTAARQFLAAYGALHA
jgi:glycosyltransferase involved in cell wall biosynthesis